MMSGCFPRPADSLPSAPVMGIAGSPCCSVASSKGWVARELATSRSTESCRLISCSATLRRRREDSHEGVVIMRLGLRHDPYEDASRGTVLIGR